MMSASEASADARNREPWIAESPRIHANFTHRDLTQAGQLLTHLDNDVIAALNCVRIAALAQELKCYPDEAVAAHETWRKELPDSME